MTVEVSRRMLIGGATAGAAALAFGGTRVAMAQPAKPPLHAPPQGVAFLGFNENPYGPAPSAIQAMAETASQGCYYDRNANDILIAMIAERFGVGIDHVITGSGSTEILGSIALAWGKKGAIICPELFYEWGALYAERKGVKVVRVPQGADMGIDLDAMAAQVGPDVSLVKICNPNNPTGMLLDGQALRAFIRKVGPQATVLVDEAYNELTDVPEQSSVVDMVKEGHNVIVARTFSKIYGMAGLRVGYAIAAPEKIQMIQDYMTSLGGNNPGLAAAVACYNDTAFTQFSRNRILEAREILLSAVKRQGLVALPSQTNFLFVKVPDADALQKAMEARGIMIRGAYGKWKNWSRVSTGKLEDVRRYAAALPEALKA